MSKHEVIEADSLTPLEIREDDPIAAAVRAVEEMRASSVAFQTNMTTELRTRDERISQLETRLNRPAIITRMNEDEPSLEMRALVNYARYGIQRMPQEEIRSLNFAGGSADGAALVPQEFIAQLIRNLVLVSPVRSLALVGQCSTEQVTLPKRTANLTAALVAETAASSSSQSTYAQQQIPIYEARSYTDITQQLLEDSAFDLSTELANDLGTAFGQLEGQLFVAGTGTAQPLGLINTTGMAGITSATSGTVTADDIMNLLYSLPSFYASRGTWVMNRQTIGAIRLLKTTIGSYIWQENFQVGAPPTLLGRPVVEFPDMPNIAASAIPIIFGDFSNFRIFDRVALSLLRDPFTQQGTSVVRFWARRRFGGAVVQPAAFAALTVHA
jgi:HK97 family phage major capsid protein